MRAMGWGSTRGDTSGRALWLASAQGRRTLGGRSSSAASLVTLPDPSQTLR